MAALQSEFTVIRKEKGVSYSDFSRLEDAIGTFGPKLEGLGSTLRNIMDNDLNHLNDAVRALSHKSEANSGLKQAEAAIKVRQCGSYWSILVYYVKMRHSLYLSGLCIIYTVNKGKFPTTTTTTIPPTRQLRTATAKLLHLAGRQANRRPNDHFPSPPRRTWCCSRDGLPPAGRPAGRVATFQI